MYRGQTYKIPMNVVGFQNSRNQEELIPTAIVYPSSNMNFHEGGVGKRGGSDHFFSNAVTGTPIIRGVFDYQKRAGTQKLVFGTSTGKIYHTDGTHEIKTGMSTTTYFHFSLFNDNVFICDGYSKPQFWDQVAGTTSDLTAYPTDWSGSNYPFMMIPHARGTNARGWYIRSDAVYASKNGDAKSCGDADVKKIPVYTDTGLVGGFEFNGTLFVYSKTKTFIINDTDPDVATWGYSEAPWEGGAANFRCSVKAGNDIYLLTEEGTIYSIRAVNTAADYEQAAITRPAHIDRWFSEKVNLLNFSNFHAVFDRSQRVIYFFVQVSGTTNNTALKYFIDRPPEIAWIVHDNLNYDSGYKAASSAEYRISSGSYKIITGDYAGFVWKLEQTTLTDNANYYIANIKTKPIDFGDARVYKHFRQGHLRLRMSNNSTVSVRVWIDGERKDDITLNVSGSGAVFGTAVFGTAVFAADQFSTTDFNLGYYGYLLQLEILNDIALHDIFISELSIDVKSLGIK